MDAEVFLRGSQKLNIKLTSNLITYLPTRLLYFTSPVGSGMVTVLFERMEPVILNDLRAMVGSFMVGEVRG